MGASFLAMMYLQAETVRDVWTEFHQAGEPQNPGAATAVATDTCQG